MRVRFAHETLPQLVVFSSFESADPTLVIAANLGELLRRGWEGAEPR